jgi:hypothetical protein
LACGFSSSLRNLIPLAALLWAAGGRSSAQSSYLGASACQPCHQEIFAAQNASRMARTWLGQGLDDRLSNSPLSKTEGSAAPVAYRLSRTSGQTIWRVKLPGKLPLDAPIEASMGGSRHGYSLFARISGIGGVKLSRQPLVETRFLLGPRQELLFSPGHSAEKPTSYQTAIGRVLSPQFERKCLTCHGAPGTGYAGEPGVRCEHCHGPGAAHLQSRNGGTIVNPAKLTNAARIERCAQCHADGHDLADPMPEDLLIANQANALVRSECYIQSGEALSCSTCHGPHEDALPDDRRYVQACLSCHSAGAARHAAICPVNATGDCVVCHMPTQPKDSFRMVDHWIRVVPGTATVRSHDAARSLTVRSHDAARSLVPAKRVFLRMLLVSSPQEALGIRAELERGAPFFDLARRHSTDDSAASGGFLGAMWFDRMEPKLAAAAAKLDYGEIGPVIAAPAGQIVLQRLPRDFRWRANALFLEATDLKRKGQLRAALAKNQQALELYPAFLRALLFLGMSLGEQNDAGRAASVLETAARLYPRDTGTQLNLGIAYGALGRTGEEIEAYRRALAGEPDLVSAYLNLGAALLSAGQLEQAAETFHQGIQVNPLAPALYYNLSLVYEQQGKSVEARETMAVAAKIDPRSVTRRAQ